MVVVRRYVVLFSEWQGHGCRGIVSPYIPMLVIISCKEFDFILFRVHLVNNVSEYGGFFGVFFGTRDGVELSCVANASRFGYAFFCSYDT